MKTLTRQQKMYKLEIKAKIRAKRMIGTTLRVKLQKDFYFRGEVIECKPNIVEIPYRFAAVTYHITLKGPTGQIMSCEIKG